MFTNLAEYLQQGNNTFCLFNPNPVTGSVSTYSRNYLQWNECSLIVTYEEGVSNPTASAYTVNMGSSVTFYTNRLSTASLHYFYYSFGGSSGTIGSNITDSLTWTPPLSLATAIPSSTSGTCVITCDTYYSGVYTGSRTLYLTLNVPTSVVPSISSVSYAEGVSGLNAQFGAYVQGKSRLSVSITAAGAQGSTITGYRTTLGSASYTGASFLSGFLSTAGTNTMTVTVTDSRGRTATTTRSIPVVAYAAPTITSFTSGRCNSAGTAAQTDGTRVWISIAAAASSVGTKNTMSCTIRYKLKTATTWSTATPIAPPSYADN